MVSETDKTKIIALGRRYKAKKILLFGSSARSNSDSRDIDIAVDGIPDSLFFKFYGDLIFSLSKPVDVVDLGKKSKFTSMIMDEGVQLYG